MFCSWFFGINNAKGFFVLFFFKHTSYCFNKWKKNHKTLDYGISTGFYGISTGFSLYVLWNPIKALAMSNMSTMQAKFLVIHWKLR